MSADLVFHLLIGLLGCKVLRSKMLYLKKWSSNIRQGLKSRQERHDCIVPQHPGTPSRELSQQDSSTGACIEIVNYVSDIVTTLHEAKGAAEYQYPREVKSPVLRPVRKVNWSSIPLFHSLDE